MIIGIHQPNFIPWAGYFYKISRSDIFVFLDDVQYTKNSFINRNKVKTTAGPTWLTLPVQAGKLSQNIKDTLYFDKENNIKKIKRSLQMNYAKAPFFKDYYESFCQCLDFESPYVAAYNAHVLGWFMQQFGITTECRLSSEIDNVAGSSTERLISIIERLEGNIYLSGGGGAGYQEEELYKQHGIQLVYSTFTPFEYPQLHGDFVPYMSAIDYLFNCGPACSATFAR